MAPYTKMRQYIRPHAGVIIFAGVLLVGESSVNLSLPKILGYFVDAGVLEHPTKSLWWVFLILTGVFLVRYGFTISHTNLLGSAAARFVQRVRGKIFERLLSAKLEFHTKQSVGELTSRLVNDVSLIHSIVSSYLAQLVTRMLMLLGGIALLLYLDWKLTIWLFAVMPPVVLLIYFIGRQLRSALRDVQKRIGKMSALSSEHLSAIYTVKAFGYEGECLSAVSDQLDDVLEAALRRVRFQMVFRPTMGLLSFAIFGTLAWTGAWALDAGRLSPGALVTFLLYAGIVGASATTLAGLYGNLQEALGAADRVFAIFDAPIESDDTESFPLPDEFSGEIELRGVGFSYVKDVPVLKDISFRVPAGQTVALVGSSGAGKTTIINLLLRLYDLDEGRILIDGIDLRKINRRELRRTIGYVPQTPVLFHGTIRSNLLFGVGEASQEALEEATRGAFIHDFIMGLPRGYDAPVGEGGVTLSAGQRQRIALARMMLKNPSLMLLDEPTSALDKESSHFVCEILRTRFAGRTILLITNDPSMVQIADLVIVFQSGRIELGETPQAFLALQESR